MGIDFGKMFSDAAKGVSDFLDKTGKDITKAIDQNGDGKLDLSDLKVISDRIQAEKAETQRKADLERLKPLFPDDFKLDGIVLPKIIRVADIDKLHEENAVCKGSVGFKTVLNDQSLVTIYQDFAKALGLIFTPALEKDVYFVDPFDSGHYISLGRYFSYLKEQRVAELQRIAQSLGAKHFKVTYKERSKSFFSNSFETSESAGVGTAKANAMVSQAVSNSSQSAMTIASEMRFPGHAPLKPELRYLKKEVSILNLIKMRMDPFSPLQQQNFSIELINSSGIKQEDAVKIDTMLKAMKIASGISVVSEVENEARRALEYEIEF